MSGIIPDNLRYPKIKDNLGRFSKSPNTKIVNCEECGKQFVLIQSVNKRFCSINCAAINKKRKNREIRVCACGCGETFEIIKTSNKMYILGHNNRGKNNQVVSTLRKGKTYSEIYGAVKAQEVKNKIGKNNTIDSEIRQCRCGCNEVFECKVSSKKKYIDNHSVKTLEFRSQARQRILNRTSYRQTNTKPHKILKNILEKLHLGKLFISECKVNQFVKVDEGNIDHKLAIEVFGDYWHRNPNNYSLEYVGSGISSENVWSKDSKRINTLISWGWKVLILWEKDLIKNTDACQKKVEDLCRALYQTM